MEIFPQDNRNIGKNFYIYHGGLYTLKSRKPHYNNGFRLNKSGGLIFGIYLYQKQIIIDKITGSAKYFNINF